jgi:hypothetical protein
MEYFTNNFNIVLELGKIGYLRGLCRYFYLGVLPHAHQLKNENKMNFRSNKLKTRNVLLVLKSTHTK